MRIKLTHNLAQEIIRARELLGLSRQDFARMLGIKYATLGSYETGRAKSISLETFEKIQAALPQTKLPLSKPAQEPPLSLDSWVLSFKESGFDALGIDFLDAEIKNLSGLLTERQRRILLNLAVAVFSEEADPKKST